MRRATTLLLFAVLLAGVGGLAFAVDRAGQHLTSEGSDEPVTLAGAAQPPATTPRTTRPATPTPTAQRRVVRSKPLHLRPELVPGKRLLGPGDHGAPVRELQARLRQIAWLSGDVDDDWDATLTDAVRGFQAKRGIAVTGYVDPRTRDRLEAMTHQPTADELANRLTPMGNEPGALDPRCRTGRVLCIDKTSRTLRWVVDNHVLRTVDVRFGASYSPTREGVFHVYWKDVDHVSSMYGSAMPYSMFFSRGQAIHYSSDFAARGYAGASHGCVNVRDHAGIAWLFSQVHEGDDVVIYWS